MSYFNEVIQFKVSIEATSLTPDVCCYSLREVAIPYNTNAIGNLALKTRRCNTKPVCIICTIFTYGEGHPYASYKSQNTGELQRARN